MQLTITTIETPTITVLIDRSLSLGGGRTQFAIFPGASVGGLKQAIHRQCAIPLSLRILLHNSKYEPLENDEQTLNVIGITDRSSLFVTVQGTVFRVLCACFLLE